MLVPIIAAVPVIIWVYLLSTRCRFPALVRADGIVSKRVIAVVPARNEADVIGRSITSLLTQSTEMPVAVVLVDDASEDGTAALAQAAADAINAGDRLTIVSSTGLPSGWTGKLWAVSQGVAVAETFEPDYLLLTDADVVHGKRSVPQLLAMAETGNYDLTSYMVKLSCDTLAEKALIPAFVFFFFMLYPPHWIANPASKTAGAAGGCMLIRPGALQRIGGIGAIRNEVIDDCALARAVKNTGGRLWLGLTHETRSIRSYGSFGEIGRMISRTAFNQLQHSTLLLAGTLFGLFLTYMLPVLLIFSAHVLPALMGVAAWAIMSITYSRMIRFYRLPLWWSLALPAIAVFYSRATVRSAFDYWQGRGGNWKGRNQDARA